MMARELIRKQRLWLVGLFGLIAVTAVAGMGLGQASLSFDRLIPTLLGQGTFKEEYVLFSIRLPRIAITLLAGMALALSGAILQGITRNELADPGIIGINSGAGVAVTVYYMFFPIDAGVFVWLVPAVAFAGALTTALLIWLAAYRRGSGLHPLRLVLIGAGTSIALSGLMIVLISSVDRFKVDFIKKWLAGSIWGADWPFVLALLPWLAVLVPFVLLRARRLNLLELGEPEAIGLGVPLTRERAWLLLAAVALAAAAVSMTGAIAFVGLMAPHIAKRIVGPRHQLSIPLAILIGGWLLLVADTIGRNTGGAEGIAAGTMAALIGAPYFLYLLMRR
ncbi:MAG: iron ABC transporter permease [Thermobacillus sp. ZCTH02-B1]|uniref:FecCD family ABC transporter permease n=1 Tax=Thermobacillus sp. ZCTH02-B1 TaxID=1858795 RepID=UPI000B5686C2|nr:iron ABC transporter permease [Thermobacillus sp. ZCTH02-B1]OUM97197.1 MAG: iron ABC transporter permease [Thermobacillus sp. ZCTH02-B1]